MSNMWLAAREVQLVAFSCFFRWATIRWTTLDEQRSRNNKLVHKNLKQILLVLNYYYNMGPNHFLGLEKAGLDGQQVSLDATGLMHSCACQKHLHFTSIFVIWFALFGQLLQSWFFRSQMRHRTHWTFSISCSVGGAASKHSTWYIIL